MLLRDDHAIDTIWRKLRGLAKQLSGRGTEARNAVAAARRYIRFRKLKMRYAAHHAANLPIGSGATESTCWQMQQRVKLPGQSWDSPGLRGVLAMRALVLSDRWSAAWQPFAGRVAAYQWRSRERPNALRWRSNLLSVAVVAIMLGATALVLDL